MTKEYISIQDAAKISGKSVQTIRRAVKSKKLFFKKQKTPQGFNYLIDKQSLCELYKVKTEAKKEDVKENTKAENKKEIKSSKKKSKNKKEIAKKEENKEIFASAKDLQSLSKALEKMLEQHSEERQNFLRLINTLNEKIFVLENQLNLLKAPKKSWFAFWK
ncbi:hypothetical protein GF354_06745 [Candidatus Peregrinibacteria bacterium]|nr:hypothetical protein [Candidatus Peregrinibacteria bacterium]